MAVLDESFCVCDKCGRRSEPGERRRAAVDTAAAAGWLAGPGYEWLCPECRLPGFSADGRYDDACDPCAKCGHGNASVKWMPALKGHFVRVDGRDADQERMCRTCRRCGYSWNEAMPKLDS